MPARGAGNGTPDGRRSQSRIEAADRGRGRGGGGRGAGTGRGMGAGGARLRRRDGSGRLRSAGAAGVGVGVTAVSSPARTAAPVATPGQPARAVDTYALGLAHLTNPDACISCGICVDVCPRSAVELDELPVIHEDLCTGCGECVEACPRGALTLVAA